MKGPPLAREEVDVALSESVANVPKALAMGAVAELGCGRSAARRPMTKSSISPGTRLGPYGVQSLLGEGGMGQVYRARDSRLNRTVAIKVLSSPAAASPELKERFEREARAVGSLNHPHICTLHDLGQQDGVDYLVMEYLEGETLAARLRRGALPLDQVLRCAIEIADGLSQAHRSGVVHRDLKPANVMLTRSTGVKILDFGLAKLRAPGPETGAGLSSVPTESRSLTDAGMLLGTAPYMAPEQVEGREVDSRADIFAFGAVVYEMATGERAFEGQSAASVIAAILSSEPSPISSHQPLVPRALDRVVQKCLAKSPEDRWQTARDLKDELLWIQKELSLPSEPVRGTSLRRWALAAAALVGVIGTSLGLWSLLRSSAAPSAVVRSVIPLPADHRYTVDGMALSRDGTRLVFGAEDPLGRLYLRVMSETEAKPIPGTEGSRMPFFSPRGDWLAFFTPGKLMKLSLGGGAPVALCDAPNPFGGTWGPDDTIVFNAVNYGGLMRVSAGGGPCEVLTTPDRKKSEKSHRFPDFLPDGKSVIFSMGSAARRSLDEQTIEALSLETGERKVLIEGGMSALWSSSGHLVYHRGDSLVAVPFDPERLVVTGPPVTVLEGVFPLSGYTGGVRSFALSGNGALVFVPSRKRTLPRLVFVNREGKVEPISEDRREFLNPRISPDGKRLAVRVAAWNDEIWLYDFSRDAWTQLTSDWDNFNPIWTSDSAQVTFMSTREGPFNLFSLAADGSGQLEQLTTSDREQVPFSWSPDGRFLAFGEGGDIWILAQEGDRKPQPLFNTLSWEQGARFSPDGRWLAYVSWESDHPDVYVRPFPGPGGKWQISTRGGFTPRWSGDGDEIFYVEPSETSPSMMAVDIVTTGGFRAAKPRKLFEWSFRVDSWDVTRDGQRFLAVEEVPEESRPGELGLVIKWGEELKRLVPVETR